jgi:hypothetical protein
MRVLFALLAPAPVSVLAPALVSALSEVLVFVLVLEHALSSSVLFQKIN